MEFYFFLKAPGFDAAITLCNFPPTAEIGERGERCYICRAFPENGLWSIGALGALDPGEARTIRASDLGWPADRVSSTLLFLNYQELNGEYMELPRDKAFSCTPSWRANLRVEGRSSSASYQGEYPNSMLDNPKGTLISVSPMHQPGRKNALFFANFTRRARVRTCKIRFCDLQNSRLLNEVEVSSNSVNYIDLSALQADFEPSLVVAASNEILGIPIYFSHDLASRELSLEHTHPPVEMTVFGDDQDRFRVAANVKRNWLTWAYGL